MMGIYIKGMDMPKNCECCEFAYWSNMKQANVCEMSDDAVITNGMTFKDITARPAFCPMTEVKEPHGELIDRDDLKRTVKDNEEYFRDGECCSYFHNSANEPSTELWCVDEWIDGQPTIIERSEDDEQ